ncbi:MAG: thymidine phosphorylase [Myxococcaceae bacterium]
MRAYEWILAKRNGGVLSTEHIDALISGYTRGEVTDYQMAAMCMAIYFRGLNDAELRTWMNAMMRSGTVVDLSDIPGTKVDKHSTGGVGDKVSLPLAPWVAACGVRVPMVSGRGLGHTGGTLDKLQSIPGFQVDLPLSEYRRLVREVGACLIGQTAELVPADRKLYALRDVTATVDCLPLIASSIMSKKLAEGIDALVLDVKVGSGAFLKSIEQARLLAKTMIGLGNAMGRKTVALLTQMDQPLGRAVGNALEVRESMEVLRGRGPSDVQAITRSLGAEMLQLGGVAQSEEAARVMLDNAMKNGSAYAKWLDIVAAQGGDVGALERDALPQAPLRINLEADRSGFVMRWDTEAVGHAAVALGAGRATLESRIDPAVGFVFQKKVGEPVKAGETLVEIHAASVPKADEAKARLLAACTVGEVQPAGLPMVLERIT